MWTVLGANFCDVDSLVAHQINSFNRFIGEDLDLVIKSFSPIEINGTPGRGPKAPPAASRVQQRRTGAHMTPTQIQLMQEDSGRRPQARYSVAINNVCVGRPHMFDSDNRPSVMLPNDARLRHLTYASLVTADFDITASLGGEVPRTKKIRSVHVCTLPIMVGSDYCALRDRRLRTGTECQYDPFGYFVVNGAEKVLCSLDRITENRALVFAGNKSQGFSHVAEVRSVSDNNPGCPKVTSVALMTRPNAHGQYMRVNVCSLRAEIPLCVLFRALGVETDMEIVDMVCSVSPNLSVDQVVKELRGSLADGAVAFTETDALMYMARYMNQHSPLSSMIDSMLTRKEPAAKASGGAPPASAAGEAQAAAEASAVPGSAEAGESQASDSESGKGEAAHGSEGAEAADGCAGDSQDEKKWWLRSLHRHSPPTVASITGGAVSALVKDLFPHVGGTRRDRACFLAYLVARLLSVKNGMAPFDDRDSYTRKRMDTPGALMTSLFRQYFGKMVREVRTMLYKELGTGSWRTTGNILGLLTANNLSKVVRPSIVSAGLTYALATGNWGVKNSRSCKQGVAQVLNRMTYNATVSHLRRVNTPIEKTGKLVQPRKLHSTHWGVICLAETPEGSSIGLVKNMALTVTVTTRSSPRPVSRCLVRLGVRPLAGRASRGASDALVMLNGFVAGVHPDPLRLSGELRALKRSGQLSPFLSVVWDPSSGGAGGEIRLNTEAGRCCRPLAIVDPGGRARMASVPSEALRGATMPQLVCGMRPTSGQDIPALVEYLDVEEVDASLVAMCPADLLGPLGPRYTHLELSPTSAFGVVASTIPFAHHNQSPRNTYQCAMAKQAIGVYSTAFRQRFDTMAHVIDSPQKPLVNTRMARRLRVDTLPCGVNAVVAIMAHTGFNQEDSLILNEGAVQRGLFSSTFYRTYKEHNSRNHSTGEEEQYYRPSEVGGLDGLPAPTLKALNYRKLAPDGFVPEGTFVQGGDVIVGKCMPHKHPGGVSYRDCSIAVKNNECGFVDMNCHDDNRFPTCSNDCYKLCKVRLRSTRVPTVGDKFSSRHGQKGTVGALRKHEDMPFTAEGIVPDVIINPHAIPSRMTIGQLMECVLGKSCCMSGVYGDATPFDDRNPGVDDIGSALEAFGLQRHGNEVMVDGLTGAVMTAHVFVGPTFYQRLKHMTTDKCHARAANGPVTSLVRQPAEGRARDGGLRLGEMEVDCLVSHGISHFLKERIMEASDNYRIFVCNDCGMLATYNPSGDVRFCAPCRNTTNFSELRVPYAFKLLTQEIETMGIGVKYFTGNQFGLQKH